MSLKKLKLKFKTTSALILGLFYLFVFIGGYLVNSQIVRAQTRTPAVISLKDLTVTTELEINGKPDNLIRINKSNPQPVQVTVYLTINSPQAAGGNILVGGSNPDVIDTGAKVQPQRPLIGFGSMIVPASKDNCSNSSLPSDYLTENLSFLQCNPSAYLYKGNWKSITIGGQVDSLKIPVGQKITLTFDINSSLLSSLKIPQTFDKAQSLFYLTPWSQFQVVSAWKQFLDPNFGNNDVATFAFNKAGKEIYVQYINSDSDPRPDIPAYNSATGGATTGATGNSLVGFLNELINLLVGLIQELVYFIFTFLVEPLLEATLSIRTYTDQFAAVIYPGWQIIRNLCNILFIVALIAIAMGTLLRLEKYQYKDLLVQLIIAALLVNFSLFVGQAVLGVADTVQNQFLPNNKNVIRSLAKDLMVRNHTVITNAFSTDVASEGYFSNTVKPLFGLIVTTGTFMVFVAIAAYLCIRIVMLWIFLMISPIAYAAGALPSTAHYREEWWSNFLKYAFFTPVMAFCLNMAAVILNGQSTNVVLKQIAGASFIESVASSILLLIFLLASLKVAESFSIVGADSITKFAKQGMFAPAKFTQTLAKAGAERGFEVVQDKLHMNLDPRVWSHEMEEYLKKKKKDRALAREELTIKGVPTGSPRDLLENYANWGGIKRDRKSRFGLSSYSNKVKEYLAAQEKAERLLPDPEKNTEVAKLNRFNTRIALFENQKKLSNTAAQEMNSVLQELISSMKKELDAAQDLEKSARVAGRDKEADKHLKLVTELQAKLTEINANQTNLATQIAAGGDVDVSDYVNPALNPNSAATYKDWFENVLSKWKQEASISKEAVDNDDKLRAKYNISTWTAKDKADAIKNAKKLKDLAESVERPQAYYARAARLERENEEEKKISKIHDEGELNKLLRNARRLGDKPKAIAIIKKLTRDRNWNEATEDEGLGTSFEDAITFFKGDASRGYRGLQQDLGLSDHEVLEIATEIGYEAEESKQYNIARMTWIDPETGHLDWNGYTHGHPNIKYPNQHTKAVLTEASKSEPRKRYGDLPRWVYVVEKPNAITGARETLGFEEMGPDLLLDAAGNSDAIRNIASQGNTYSMRAITRIKNNFGTNKDWKQVLKDRGKERNIRPADIDVLIKTIETAAGKNST